MEVRGGGLVAAGRGRREYIPVGLAIASLLSTPPPAATRPPPVRQSLTGDGHTPRQAVAGGGFTLPPRPFCWTNAVGKEDWPGSRTLQVRESLNFR